MADIAAGLFSKLSATTGVTSLIGLPTSADGMRCYPDYDRQTDRTYPLAVFRFEITPDVAFDGPTTMTRAVLEIAGVATTYEGAVEVGSALYAALEFSRGAWGTVNVQGCFLQDDGQRDDVVTDPSTEAILYFVRSLRFDVCFDN